MRARARAVFLLLLAAAAGASCFGERAEPAQRTGEAIRAAGAQLQRPTSSSGPACLSARTAPGDERSAALIEPSEGFATMMSTPRYRHTATLLSNGKVLVTGGCSSPNCSDAQKDPLSSAEIYDPASATWSPTQPLQAGRQHHAAVLLRDGRVLVAGYPTSQLYDPGSGTWSPGASMCGPHDGFTVTLLPDGRVLAAGGSDFSYITAKSELFNPATGQWTSTGSLNVPRWYHTASLLADGRVLVAGGFNDVPHSSPWTILDSAEIYDPKTETWSLVNPMLKDGESQVAGRVNHTSTVLPGGNVLVIGGERKAGFLRSSELYDPILGTWTPIANLATYRDALQAALLPNGMVLAAGTATNNFKQLEVYDPSKGDWCACGELSSEHMYPTVTVLPDGTALVVGGMSYGTGEWLPIASAERYDPKQGAWRTAEAMGHARSMQSATLLPTGKLLVAGGGARAAESYDPETGKWSGAGEMATSRDRHTATLLPNGKVLIAGGIAGASLDSAELYDPKKGDWSPLEPKMGAARLGHTATLLPSGKVLVAGGHSSDAPGLVCSGLEQTELFDSTSRRWTSAGSMGKARSRHSATLLANGEVLVAGGGQVAADCTLGTGVRSAALYRPALNGWSAAPDMGTERQAHTATLLMNGKVLVAGGLDVTNASTGTAELYDPATGSWSATGALKVPRYGHSATLLPSGKVLVAGGRGSAGDLAGAELYDPISGAWSLAGSLKAARFGHTASLLPNGRVLVAGGSSSAGAQLDTAEVFDEGRGASEDWAPELRWPAALPSAKAIAVSGERFTGVSEGSSGTLKSSPANLPILQIRRLDSGQTAFARTTSWTATSATFSLPSALQPGHHLAWVVVNGVLSNGAVLLSAPCDVSDRCGSDCQACPAKPNATATCSGESAPSTAACLYACDPGYVRTGSGTCESADGGAPSSPDASAPVDASQMPLNGWSCGCNTAGEDPVAVVGLLGLAAAALRRTRRRRLAPGALALVVLGLISPARARAAPDKRPSLVVLDVQVSVPGEALDSATLAEVFVAGLDSSRQFGIIGPRDLASVVTLEKRRKLLATADPSGVAEIAEAVGTDYAAVASVGKIGATHVVSASLIRVKTVSVVARAIENTTRVSEIVPVLRQLASRLVDEWGARRAPLQAISAPAAPVQPSASLSSEPAPSRAAERPADGEGHRFGLIATGVLGVAPLTPARGKWLSGGAEADLSWRTPLGLDVCAGVIIAPSPGAHLALAYALATRPVRIDFGLRGAAFPGRGAYGGGPVFLLELPLGESFGLVGTLGTEIYAGAPSLVAMLGGLGVSMHF